MEKLDIKIYASELERVVNLAETRGDFFFLRSGNSRYHDERFFLYKDALKEAKEQAKNGYIGEIQLLGVTLSIVSLKKTKSDS